FSAGGQVGALLHTAKRPRYQAIDEIDDERFQPDFSLLVYPWRIMDEATGKLLPEIQVSSSDGPMFIVHTHDDNSSAVGAAKLYIALKENQVSAELHVYQNGGHGYGIRPQPNSMIHTWINRATDWLLIQKLGRAP
ncbi:MAG: prolyl oligopeptidase family serine peptidase, partial [Planctomycetota bacterium]